MLDGMKEQMLNRYLAAMSELYALETKTKQLLDSAGVQSINYVWYLDFTRQLFKLSRSKEMSGKSFEQNSGVLLEKWRARGLDPAVLNRIRHEIFSTKPAAP
jgi:hypothetical protein